MTNENSGTTEKVRRVKKKYKRPDAGIQASGEFITKQLSFSLECQRQPRVNPDNPDEIQARINWYFDRCIELGLRPGVEGMCNALGIDRRTFAKWAAGTRRAGSEQQAIAINARQVLADMMEQYMLNGAINPVAGIFLASNQFDYDRNATVTVQTAPQLVADEDPAKLAEKYGADVIDVSAHEPQKAIEDHADREVESIRRMVEKELTGE